MPPINDGGPAFVVDFISGYRSFDMTLRDKFAESALLGMLAHSTRYSPRPGSPTSWHAAISEEAYQLADAMLAERLRTPEEPASE